MKKQKATIRVRSGRLLGRGNLTGRLVEYWGSQWIISGKNYCGDWDAVRFERRDGGTVRIESTISPKRLPETHPHYARLLPPPNERGQR